MAVTSTVTLEIGRYGSIVDFTSRMIGYDLQCIVEWGQCATAKASITLKNFDGALYPNGGGTYSTTDWFSQGVWLKAAVTDGTNTSTVTMFAGLVNDIDFYDDGELSTVTIVAVDGMSKVQNVPIAMFGYSWSAETMFSLLPLGPIEVGAAWTFPQLSSGVGFVHSTTTNVIDVGALTRTTTWPASTSVTINSPREYLNTLLLPAGIGVMWPGDILFDNSVITDLVTQYRYCGIQQNFERAAGQKDALTFDDVRATISGTDLPFTNIVAGYTTDELVTKATVNRPGGTAQTSTKNTTKYGTRSVSFSNLATVNNNASNQAANRITDRFGSDILFRPLQLTVKQSTVTRYCANSAYSKWATLLSAEKSPYQQATITWTGTGASSQTRTRSVKGRRITGTPSDMTVTVYLTYEEGR